MSTPTEDDPSRRERRASDTTIEAMKAQLEELRQLKVSDPQAVQMLIDATTALGKQVGNLANALGTVNELQAEAERLRKQQLDLEARVLPKKTFDVLWEQNAGELKQIGKINRRLAAGSIVLALAAAGFGIYQVNENSVQSAGTAQQASLNGQRALTCEQRNAGSRVATGFIDELIREEQALPQSDPVFVKLLDGFKQYTQSQIVSCPGSSSSPTPTNTAPF